MVVALVAVAVRPLVVQPEMAEPVPKESPWWCVTDD
jgi:hypothetical protein